MQKHKTNKSRSRHDLAQATDNTGRPKLKRKEYEEELRKLHVELVKLQEWVRHEGEKVCGIHTTGGTGGNGATRISRPKFDRIVGWMSQY